MKIATWNVNSVRARLPRVLEWLGSAAPDVALLQEIKTVAEGFPELEIGIALNTGECVVGNIGSLKRAKGTSLIAATVVDG